ncbi:Lpg0189 family type II secretion system effector [Legionella sainthelensi]|uniref:Lpg0189 family type II secretion system effector n=1 Tax=Legionella sainthelensi TaxID=28087 RepID=UPI000E20C82B|nr:Lpg0189 family type II secretion system effector [Legionella sainthelensi]
MKIPSYVFLLTSVLFNNLHATSEIAVPELTAPEHTLIKRYSNQVNSDSQLPIAQRTTDYPTHVVRMEEVALQNTTLNCEQVHQKIDEFFVKKLPVTMIYYNIIAYCSYDVENPDVAKSYTINAYFDPVTDPAIEYLTNYIHEYNGQDLMGVPFNIEEVKKVIVSLNFDAGIRKDEFGQIILRYYHENQTHSFRNFFDVRKELITDIHHRINSNEKDTIIPLFTKWFSLGGESLYTHVLKKSDYLLLQPELIFFLDQEPNAFTSKLRMYYSHYCANNANKRCL